MGSIPTQDFLCGIWMFSLCLCGLVFLVFPMEVGLIGSSKLWLFDKLGNFQVVTPAFTPRQQGQASASPLP